MLRSHVMTHIPLHPRHPERTCWGCNLYCAADDLGCGNGTIRTMHPVELFGEDWYDWVEEQSNTATRKRPL
jgi:hypothetical protein